MRRKEYQLVLVIVLSILMTFGGIIIPYKKVNADGGITTASIDAVCSQYDYSNGKYWSYKGAANATKYTASNTGAGINGYMEYSYGGGRQCWAFARFVMYKVTNTEIGKGKWTKLTGNNMSSLKVGDIVCTGVHTAVVYKDLGNGKYQFVQVFGSENNKINYGKYSQGKTINNKYVIQQAETLQSLKNIGLQYIYRYNGSVTPVTPVATNNKPTGMIDGATSDTPGNIHISGWAYDPDAKGSSVDIHVYVGGAASPSVPCTIIKANLERKDVNNVYGCGNYHGFGGQIPTNKTGKVDVYIYAIDTAGGENTFLGSRTVDVKAPPANNKPVGTIDSVVSDEAGKIKVAGWAYDPDTKGTAVDIHVYVGGSASPSVPCTLIKANAGREDVNKVYGCGLNHGFSGEISTNKTGSIDVYIYAIDTSVNDFTFLGKKTVTISTHKHNYSIAGNVITAATCTKSGTQTYKCSCGKTTTKTVSALGHNWKQYAEHKATCTEAGETAFTKCERCGVYGIEKKTITPIGHSWGEGEVTKEATCVSDGTLTYKCLNCNELKTETIEKTGHTIVIDEAIEPTYYSTGLTKGCHCSVCNEIIEKQVIVPMLQKDEDPRNDENIEKSDNTKEIDDRVVETNDKDLTNQKEKNEVLAKTETVVSENEQTNPVKDANKIVSSEESLNDDDVVGLEDDEDDIEVPKVSNVKLTNKKVKRIYISFKAVNDCDGYEIRYATKKSMKGAKLFTSKATKGYFKNSKGKKVTFKKGKIYYIQIRAFKKDAYGEKVYGEWSDKKNIKIKK